MKLNLGAGADIRLQEYINVDLVPRPELPQQMYRQGDAFNLDWLCPEQSVDEILALNLLVYASARQVPEILAHWASRLCIGGVLKLSAVDGIALTKAIGQRAIAWEESCQLLFGGQTNELDCARSIFDHRRVSGILESAGMSLGNMRREGLNVYMEFTRHA